MSVRIKGADLIRFFEEWPPGEGGFYDDCPVAGAADGSFRWIDGYDDYDYELAPRIDPAKTYKVAYGELGWQGEGPPPAEWTDDLTAWIKRWLKAQTTTALVVDVPNGEVEAFRAMCKERGWKVK
jgi:hypothetical protein